ncbi:MAG TPA: alcohol dehydrogenase catalytic domain-containing protein [Candidatus Acidoferrales bacterium]|nr:alcohol dehydrogenase catalytic domain-containing protein [Candidatus Acidoferrales bacterium]
MRVAMYYNNRDVRLEEMPVPAIGERELLVRVRASGICGSDLMEWYRVKKAPLVLGHEIAGEVAALGAGVEGFQKGDRVFVSHHVPCMSCRYCRRGHASVCDTLRQTRFDPGGFAEYIRVPEINVRLGTFLLPEELSFEEGTFIEPLGCVVRAQRFARLDSDQTVLVIGSGIAGLLQIQLARHKGARVLATDISAYHLAAAREFGAHEVVHGDEDVPNRVRELNDGRLADLVIVCTGAVAAANQALRSVERGGSLLFFAPTAAGVTVPLPVFDYWRDEISVLTSYAASPGDIAESIELLRAGSVRARDMITHRLGLAETARGFELMAGGAAAIKIVIDPQRP